MKGAAIRALKPLSFPFQTQSPFLFAVYHLDAYPEGMKDPDGTPNMRVNRPLHNHNIGADFHHPDGWSMYHGMSGIPGFPQHPHRGFETVTVCRTGLVDHHDSLGCAGRFGNGDAQWMTAGRGVSHSEMFPCVNTDAPNPLDLFQIWLLLPAAKRMVEPYFTMLWGEKLPKVEGGGVKVAAIADGARMLGEDAAPPPPPPDSWAHDPANEVAILTITLQPGSSWTIPPASKGVNRSLFFFKGDKVDVDGKQLDAHANLHLDPAAECAVSNSGSALAELLLLQGKPVTDPTVQRGPFVMGSDAEIQQAFMDYRMGKFGAWPWPTDDPVAPANETRFARYADGRVERP
ncbi:unnamed protein product [Pedinophyceae sp. YPF-701]|nr:unnamed protein product [Pedinophyceae sp. YPF-701]